MSEQLVVVNFKTYESAHGVAAEELASIMGQIETDARMIAVVSAFDLSAVVSMAPNLEIWTQHLDPINFGSNTGWLHPETAIQRGAKGTLINHAEHKVSIEHIAMLLDSVPEGFTVCACAADIDEARALSALQPDYVAVEPPGLIGGEMSVTTADPEIVSGTARAIREISKDVGILCGAGIKNGQDVVKAIELGTSGVLLASGVTKVKDAKSALEDLVSKL
ncbi:TPA: triosephosphate isomerase [Candidatus Thalassarchaeaceae archaeon]|jgi:triosephosphate isomerase|nr:triose-phosphate isomerase [Euryarchaeota archaeon]MDC0502084.1 triose-phosphate isomerase [Euryarchaeota archaeon]HIH06222.1 triosephosphate isomerase [Candidatus Thalassarchaeaceae archaeon]HII42762.1 triosephosphate isomerase [Candidatus Thalassarchaeaceae archaeon]|tara:strand:- start:297 stop:959 length:663 start_codon:yes stop_codon:yes gene_type:complete